MIFFIAMTFAPLERAEMSVTIGVQLQDNCRWGQRITVVNSAFDDLPKFVSTKLKDAQKKIEGSWNGI